MNHSIYMISRPPLLNPRAEEPLLASSRGRYKGTSRLRQMSPIDEK
ncbi:hypothetical protein HMPREF3185_00526 [Porphyromonas somerae]|uniref:Uncharacterized protein n=1 Tax=Porphyromonas somerae TaxID=322095 RepID=A0A134BBP8_9PORP|nr:hypothetical protein HMPREF3184_00526 [Porphyromonadaceae bacterium KA00676]KXB77373.1 hypothetical protein HMPREF3185_00526 [Porphyromonas somerae]